MTSLKALLPLAVLLLLSIAPTETEVVRSMKDCNEFFLEKTPPNITGILEGGNILDQNRYKPICQTFENTRTFVTLYDTNNKIPVFSAAKYRGNHDKASNTNWKIEPQLEDTKGDNNMAPQNNQKTYKNQAVKKDYENKLGYNRGHLFPNSYAYDKTGMKSTFTLTNVVPQNRKFNKENWSNMEGCIKCVMDEYCSNKEGYVVIGALPSNNNNTLNNKINIPSMLWSAFCCYNREKNQWLASAHWGENKKHRNKYFQIETLDELHKELEKLGQKTDVFPKTCPLDTTVATVYPELYSICKCKDKTKDA